MPNVYRIYYKMHIVICFVIELYITKDTQNTQLCYYSIYRRIGSTHNFIIEIYIVRCTTHTILLLKYIL